MLERISKATAVICLFLAGQAVAQEMRPGSDAPKLIAGVCVDSSGPVRGASVTLYHSDDRLGPVKILEKQATDEQGKFSFQRRSVSFDQHGGSGFMVAVQAPGYAFKTTVLTSKLKLDDLGFTLNSSPANLVGVIMRPDGTPLVGAKVYVPNAFHYQAIENLGAGTTDAKGKFQITGLESWKQGEKAPSRRPILIAHPDYARTTVFYKSVPQVIRAQMKPPATVSGRVIDLATGRPVPNVVVSAQGVSDSGWFQTKTDGTGYYSLKMTPDRYNLWAEVDDRISIAINSILATIDDEQIGADIRMVRGGFVTGTYQWVDDEGNNLAGGSTIAHYGPARPRTGAAVKTTRVNSDGTFKMRVAPGDNFIYSMSGQSGSIRLHVGDSQTVNVDLIPGKRQDLREVKDDRIEKQFIARQRAERALREAMRRDIGLAERPPSRIRSNSIVGQLLDQLETLNAGALMYQDPWLRKLKEIADVGSDATDELIEELDATSDQKMMRCVGFLMRAIGDRRAVPALIRALPKTLLKPGSDMGVRTQSEVLKLFAQKHDLDEKNVGNDYGFARPVREICGAIQRLTGHRMGDEQIFHIFLSGTDGQKQLKKDLFHRHAQRWANWWEHNAKRLDVSGKYASVGLPNYQPLPPTPVEVGISYKRDSGSGNCMMQMVTARGADHVFFDLDTSRQAGLPKRWKDVPLDDLPIDEIAAWAREEGFDMMGVEHEMENGESCYAIRLLGIRAMQLPMNRWKKTPRRFTIEELIEIGNPIGEFLFKHDSGSIDYLAHAPFFVVTAEETPAILYLGIEVRDDSRKPGGVAQGDDELNPVAFRRGRRYAYELLTPATK